MIKQDFNRDWLFHLGDVEGARWNKKLDKNKFTPIDLPHDWSIELRPDPKSPSGASGGFFPMGTGWYLKYFKLPENLDNEKVFIEFEGVYMNSETWINGHYLGRHPYGYTSYCYDLTPYIIPGEENVLSVFVDNSHQVNSRWYSGSGIYRPVWLMISNSIHIAHWGTNVAITQLSDSMAEICVNTKVQNQTEEDQKIMLRSRIISADGSIVGTYDVETVIGGCKSENCNQYIHVDHPLVWSPEFPSLYKLESEVWTNGSLVDTAETFFGIRMIHFDAENGFMLNGKQIKLKGGCVHHDNGVLGAASYARSEQRKVELLKANGFNAVRCAHNPPAPAFLDACDRLGMLVIDEAFDCWREGKNNGDYHTAFDDWWEHDLENMVYRDRNHPSVIMWSIGNELLERDGRSKGAEIAKMLADHVRALDPTRPVTAAINGGDWNWEKTDGIFYALDVCGYNYQKEKYIPDHVRQPLRIIYGSESTPGDALKYWNLVMNHNHVIGDFVWTAWDYLGEAGIGRVEANGEEAVGLGKYPWNQANCGDIDLCGFKRPQSYYRDIVWQHKTKLYVAVNKPILEGKTASITYWGWPDVMSSWTWPGYENQTLKVDVYSSCEEVALYLNEELLERKSCTIDEEYIATFDVPYQPGVLKAVGYINGVKETEYILKTANKPERIRLLPDRDMLKAEYGDLCFVTVEIVDHEGNVHPAADHNIFFSTKGEGSIAAVGSSNPASEEPYVGNQRRSYRGRCLVVIKANGNTGTVTLRAYADDLDGDELTLQIN